MLHIQIGKLIKDSDNFAIVSHTSPDGDSMGAILGLYNALIMMGKSVDIFLEEAPPDKFSFLPNFKRIRYDKNYGNYSYLFILDCGDLERLGNCMEIVHNCKALINIDHHISNKLFGNINIVDANASSTGELIYEILKINGFNITKDIAACLYTSILTDTGGFKYSNTTSVTLTITGDLINTGIDFPEINSIIYNRKSISQVKLMSMVTSTIEMFNNNTISLLLLTREMLEKCNATDEEAEEFINIARDIKGVEVSVFLKEKDKGKYKISLRSNKYVDVRIIAEAFNGGGHIRAAGCTIEGKLNNVKSKLIDEIIKHMDVMA